MTKCGLWPLISALMLGSCVEHEGEHQARVRLGDVGLDLLWSTTHEGHATTAVILSSDRVVVADTDARQLMYFDNSGNVVTAVG